MTRIQVHPDEMEKNVRLLQQSKQQLGKIVYELDKTMYFLQSEWSGVTSEKFFWDFMNIKESVFPSTLGLLDIFQDKLSMTLSAFKKADNSGGEMLQIPDKLEPNFATGLIDKAIGDTVTGVSETVEALFYNPFSTLGSLAYDLTVGKIVDVGRGIGFAWDTAWGTGTARSNIEQFVNEQKKQLSEDESGYYKGAVIGQALSYFIFGKALHSKDHGSGGSSGSGEGKKEPEKESGKEGKGEVVPVKPIEPRGEPNVFIPVFKGEEITINIYDRMRLTGLDKREIETISKNTGLSLDEVTAMKKHLFLTKHTNLVDENGKYYYEGYLTPDINLAYGWGKALSTELPPAEKAWFRELADHELAESKLMQEGMPIRKIESFKDGKPSDGYPPGAHDLAPPQPGDFPEIVGNELGDISTKMRSYLDNMEGKDE